MMNLFKKELSYDEELFLAEWAEEERLIEVKNYGVKATSIMIGVLGLDVCANMVRSEYEHIEETQE